MHQPQSRILPFLLALAMGAVAPSARALTDEQREIPLEQESPDPALAKIVIIAGSVSAPGPGKHEYFAGCSLMMKWLKASPGVWPVLVADGWPKNEHVLDHAATIVCYMDGGAKLALLAPERWAVIQKAMDQGAGLVMLHQTVDIPDAHAATVSGWLGGAFTSDIGCRGHWDMEFSKFPDHPIMRGVTPFSAPLDGWLYNLHFASQNVTPLLVGQVPDKSRTSADAKEHIGRDEVIAWAYDRPGGGRSFGFTGCDLHRNWGVESQRRLVVNGILWTAHREIPAGGAPVDLDPADLKRWWDAKPTPKPAAAKPTAAAPDPATPAAQAAQTASPAKP